MFIEVLTDTAMDSVEILPFLFIAFCILEIFSHRSGKIKADFLSRFKYAGPFLGAILGCVPQCGIPVLAVNLYSGAIITPGTLIAVLISTSDEAILVLLNDPAGQKIILPLLAVKLVFAALFGYLADLFLGSFFDQPKIVHMHDDHDFCHSHGILLSALKHTVELFTYLFLFSLALNFLLHTIGSALLAKLMLGGSVFQPLLAALIGLIPNCAAALLICELYLDGILSFASLTAGLCTSAGVGLLVLIKTNTDRKELLKIIAFLYTSAVITGIVLQIFA